MNNNKLIHLASKGWAYTAEKIDTGWEVRLEHRNGRVCIGRAENLKEAINNTISLVEGTYEFDNN